MFSHILCKYAKIKCVNFNTDVHRCVRIETRCVSLTQAATKKAQTTGWPPLTHIMRIITPINNQLPHIPRSPCHCCLPCRHRPPSQLPLPPLPTATAKQLRQDLSQRWQGQGGWPDNSHAPMLRTMTSFWWGRVRQLMVGVLSNPTPPSLFHPNQVSKSTGADHSAFAWWFDDYRYDA